MKTVYISKKGNFFAVFDYDTDKLIGDFFKKYEDAEEYCDHNFFINCT